MIRSVYHIMVAVILLVGATSDGFAQQSRFGALAYSPSRGIDGYSFNYKSKAAAQQRAIKQCRSRAKDCRIVANFRGSCAALAVGRGLGWGVASGKGRTQVRSRALLACRQYTSGCRVQRAVCS